MPRSRGRERLAPEFVRDRGGKSFREDESPRELLDRDFHFQKILIVRYRYALLGSQLRDAILGDLMNLATGPSLVIFWSINRALCDDYQPFWSLTYSPDTLVAAKDEPPECPRFDAFLRADKW